MPRKSQHVVPTRDGSWSVRKSGAERASKSFTTKESAVGYAREVSKNQGSELYIHKRDGTIQESRKYGNKSNSKKK
jgi:hypothetical protein